MKKRRLLDSHALLAYLNQEAGFQKVRDVMAEFQKSEDSILMNEINIGEVYYILSRKRGRESADYFLETILPSLPVKSVSNSFEDIIGAARIKAEHPISFADCFAVATATRENASILTGDPEFKRVESLVSVEWL
jgi:ribonuclease VapC